MAKIARSRPFPILSSSLRPCFRNLINGKLRMLKLDMLAGGIVKIPEIAIPVTQDPASPYFIHSSEKTSQPIVSEKLMVMLLVNSKGV